MAGLSGDTGVKGLVDNVDISFDQLLRQLTHVPIVLSADIRYQRWELFGDGRYMEVGASGDLEQTMMGAKTLEAQIADGTARCKATPAS
jgi:hypothetical protein